MASTQKTFATILGIVLLVVGLAGFVGGGLGIVRGGFFGTNPAQDVLHIIAGLFGIWFGTKGMGYGYNQSIGWIGIVLAVLGFIPVVEDLLILYLDINTRITILHAVIGVVALIVYYTADR
ncbi:MAG: DUF4383 domain-containing protein [Nanoarchaeota archaeon]